MSRVAALVPAYDEAALIAGTVDALRGIDEIDEVVVIDDASTDDTATIAAEHGATVVRLRRNVGKGGALRAGLKRTDADIIVLIDADLGSTAAVAGPLLAPVLDGSTDMSIAAPPPGAPSGLGLVEGFARWVIARLGKQRMSRPLSGQRALRREILDRFGIADGFGVEVALTIDALRAGYRVIEVPYAITHTRTGRDAAGFIHRGRQGADVVRVLGARASRARGRARGTPPS